MPMHKLFGLIGWMVMLVLGISCDSEPKPQQVVFDENAMQARAAMVDRFDFLTQSEDLSQASAFIDSLEKLDNLAPWLVWTLHDVKGRLAELHGNFDQSLFEINQLIRYFEENQVEESVLTQAYFRRGDLLMLMRQYDLAFQDFFRGVGKGSLARDACLEANFNYRLGMVSYKQSNFREAQGFFEQSFALFDSCADPYSAMYRRQEVASNIGLCYLKMEAFDSSLVWFDQALAIVSQLPVRNPADEARAKVARWVAYGNKGISLYAQGSYGAGRRFMRESYESNLSHIYGDKGHGAFVGNTLAGNLIKENRLSEADAILARLEESGALKPNSQVQHHYLLNRIQYFQALGQLDSVWPYFVQYNQVADSIRFHDRQLIKMNTALLLRGLDKDYALRAEKDRSESRLQLNRAIVALLILGVLVLAGVVLTLKRSRKQNKQLSVLNKTVQDQNDALALTAQQLQQANADLSVLNHQQARLLRVVAHDLRNPLAAIQSLSKMRLEEKSQSVENREFFELANKACQGGLVLINDLLESMEGQNSAQRPLSLLSVNAKSFLEDTLLMVQFRADEKQVRLELLEVDPTVDLKLDEEHFRRALINLITNAIKFSRPGGRVWLHLQVVNNGLKISIHDQGIGIAPADLEKLFDAFTGVRRLGTAGEKSFGLGLSITKKIVELHRGKITVQSTLGAGTTFEIWLPHAKV